MSITKPLDSLVFLNAEGDIIKAIKAHPNRFIMIDEKKKVIADWKRDQLRDWIHGQITITDSKGREWNYPEEPEGMGKPDKESIDKFLG